MDNIRGIPKYDGSFQEPPPRTLRATLPFRDPLKDQKSVHKLHIPTKAAFRLTELPGADL